MSIELLSLQLVTATPREPLMRFVTRTMDSAFAKKASEDPDVIAANLVKTLAVPLHLVDYAILPNSN